MLTRLVKTTIILYAFIASAVNVPGADRFNLCPKGLFVSDSGGIEFKANYFSDFKLCSTEGMMMNFVGPIFPPYKLPSQGKVKISGNEMSTTQPYNSVDAEVTKTFSLVNGGILTNVVYNMKNGEKPKGNVKYRVLISSGVFAGKQFSRGDSKTMELAKEKSSKYIFLTGHKNDEFRFQINPELEVGLKFISGVGDYACADCRHHGKPEPFFHIYINMSGNELKYFLCLLKPGEPFPLMVPSSGESKEKNISVQAQTKNLLGPGSGFEIGPTGMRAFAAYSWDEAWTSPGITPVFDDGNSHSGKYSLKLTAEDIKNKNGRFNHNKVWFSPVRLDPSKEYTMSAWMKSNVLDTRAQLSVTESWGHQLSRVINVTNKWEKYSFTFKPEIFKLLNFRHCAISILGSANSLWIDDVQLEEGTGSQCRPEPLEIGAHIEQPYKLFTPGELKDANIKIYYRNNSMDRISTVLDYKIKDYWDKVAAQGRVDNSSPANSNSTENVKIPQLPCGYYRVDFDSPDKKYHDEVIFGVYEPVNISGRLPDNWPLGCHNSEGNPLIRKLGFGWTRGWEFSFKQICQEEGKYDFRLTDIIVERCRKAGINLMPIIGPDFGRRSYNHNGNAFIPEWAMEKTVKSSVEGSMILDVSFPRIDAWKTYVKALVSRYKNDIRTWEILNEPNCWLTPEEYVPYLKAAYEAAKEADPDCRIVGICSTSDWGGDPAPWTKRVMEIDQCKSMDILSIHMYSHTEPEEYKGMGSDGMLSFLKKELKKYGRDIPVWHTEKSHNTTKMGYSDKKIKLPAVYLREPGFRVPDFRVKTEYLIRETLIDSSVGHGPFFWFGKLPNDIYIMSHSNEYGLGHTEFDNSPCPEVIAANGLARMLEGRNNPKELFKLDSSKYCALYEGEKGCLAALWDSRGDSVIKLPDSIGSFELRNLFGTEFKKESGNRLKLGGTPVYLLFDTKSATEVKKNLMKSESTGRKLTFSGGPELEKGEAVLAVYGLNQAMQDLDVKLDLSGKSALIKVLENRKELICSMAKYGRAVFPLVLPDKLDAPAEFTVSGAGESVSLIFPPYTSKEALTAVLSNSSECVALKADSASIRIDGDLSDWNTESISGAASSDKVKLGRNLWKGPMDLSCEIRYRWNSEKLFVAALIYDDVLERNAPVSTAYTSDCLELFVGLDHASKSRAAGSKRINTCGAQDFQIFLAPGMPESSFDKAEAWCCQLKGDGGIKVASKTFKYGYVLEAAIPWKALDSNFKAVSKKKLLICFQVTDADTKGMPPQKKIFWSGDEGNWMSPVKWGTLTLK